MAHGCTWYLFSLTACLVAVSFSSFLECVIHMSVPPILYVISTPEGLRVCWEWGNLSCRYDLEGV